MNAMEKGRTNDPEGLKRRVIDAAFQNFTTKGFNRTALQDLLQEIGVSGGAYSHHFASKKDLVLAVITNAVANAVDKSWIAPVNAAASTKQGVRAVFQRIIRSLDEAERVSGCPLNNLALELATQDPDIRAAIDDVFSLWRAALAKKIEDDQLQGKLKHLKAEDAAIFIIATYSGAMAMAKVSNSALPLRICSRQLMSYLS
jgi:AcrR family transcriptional regulator